MLALPSFEAVPAVYKAAKSYLSEIISAFEYFDRQAYNLVCKWVTSGFSAAWPAHSYNVHRHTSNKALDESEVGDSPAFVLIETSGGNEGHDQEVGPTRQRSGITMLRMFSFRSTVVENDRSA